MSITRERIKYFDTLRALAIISIIAVHVFQTFPHVEVMHFRIYSLIEVVRFGVPIFLMLSGALLLNREIDLGTFFKKRFTRLTYPYILYLIIYVMVLYLLIVNFSVFSDLNIYFKSIPLSYNWYFYLIASLYLSIPIINKFIQYSSLKEIEYFITIFLFGSLFYQIMLYFKITHFIDLSLFVGPIGYLILGYYLANKDFKISNNKIISLAIMLFLITTMLKVCGELSIIPSFHIFDAESKLTNSFLDVGILQILQSAAVFVAFKYIYESKTGIYSKIRKYLENKTVNSVHLSLSKASYGMYLFHHTLVEPIRIILAGFALSGSLVCLLIIILTIFISFVSWMVVVVLHKIPIIGKCSGYH